MFWSFFQFAEHGGDRVVGADSPPAWAWIAARTHALPLSVLVVIFGLVLLNILAQRSGHPAGLQAEPGDKPAVVFAFASSHDGRTVATGDIDGTVALWDTATRKISFSDSAGTLPVRSVAVSPDGKTLAVGGWGRYVQMWDIESGARLTPVEIASEGAYEIGFSRDGTLLAVRGFPEKSLEILDWQTGPVKPVVWLRNENIHAFAFDPRRERIAPGGHDGKVRLRALPTGQTLAEFYAGKRVLESMTFSPSGLTLATKSDDDPAIRLWDAGTLKPTVELPGHVGPYTFMAFSHDETLFASVATEGIIRIWDPITGHRLDEWKAQGKWIRGVAFCPDNRTLVTPDPDKSIRLWNLQ